METFVETRPTKYTPGQRLRADTVNWIIDSIGNTPVAAKYTADDRQAIIRDTRPEEPAPEEPRPARPFDLSTSYEEGQAKLVVTNCEFHDGGSLTKLADKTIEDTDELSSIFLYKQKQNDDWKLATNVEVESADIQIMLYQISSYELSNSNGVPVETSGEKPRAVTVAMDYRDTMNTIGGSGGSGGGDCSCDVSAYFTTGDKLATWTNGTKTVDIYSNVLSNDIRDIRNRVGYTPFFYDVSQQKIINNFFYVNRTLHEIHGSGYAVTAYGTYYLKISHYTNTDTYEIVQDAYTGIDTGGLQNTNTASYYKLWTITPNLVFDWRQALCIPFYERD